MPKNLTDVATFTDPVSVPVDTDARNAASVEVPFQALANRTRQLKDQLETSIVPGTGEFIYPSNPLLPTRTIELDPMSMQGADWGTETGFQHREAQLGAREHLYLDLGGVLPSDAYVISLQAIVKPAAARGALDRMRLALYAVTADWSTYAALSLISEAADDDGTTDWQGLSISPTEAVFTTDVDFSARRYLVRIAAGNGTAGDLVRAVRINFSDPGPRNY